MKFTQIGKVTHYYDKIGVAVVKLNQAMKVGDKIKISGHDKEFSQVISSMQVEHDQINEAKKGAELGIKVEQAVREGDVVYLEQ